MSESFNQNTAEFNLDLTYLRDVSSGSNEFMIEMIDLFLAQTPEYFENLEKAIIEENWSKVADIAHKIKPTLAFMGAIAAKDSMGEIEINARNLTHIETIAPAFKALNDFSKVIFSKLKEVRDEL